MGRILITGGSGLIGKHLCQMLTTKGYDTAILSRSQELVPSVKTYVWDTDKRYIDPEALTGTDYIIHLAGANIGEARWTKKRKKIIIESRTDSGLFLHEMISRNNIGIRAFISASAIGYYGAVTSERIYDENDPPSNDFLGKTCLLWEQASGKFSDSGIRTVIIRTGVVLTSKGGALASLVPPARYGLAVTLGKGNQYIPWIHIDDLCNIYLKAIEDNNMIGVYNAVAPEHTTNMELGKTLVLAVSGHAISFRIPAAAFKIRYGEMADMLLYGSRVSSAKIIYAGYRFHYPEISKALADLYGKISNE